MARAPFGAPVSRLVFGGQSIALKWSISRGASVDRLMRSLALITGLTDIFHVRKIVVNHRPATVLVGALGAHDGAETVRPWDLSFLHDTDFGRRFVDVWTLMIEKSSRNCNVSVGVDTLLKSKDFVVLEDTLLRLPVDGEVDDPDQFLVLVPHCKQLEHADHKFKFLALLLRKAQRGHFRLGDALRLVDATILALILTTSHLRKIEQHVLIVEVGDPRDLFHSLNVRFLWLRVVALARQLQVDPRRDLHLHFVNRQF